MAQEFRKFDLETPWSNFPKYVDAPITAGYKIVEPEKDSIKNTEKGNIADKK
jgi:hypothetical protein